MKKLLGIALLSLGLFSSSRTYAQDFTNGRPGMYPEQIDFTSTARSFQKGSVIIADEKGKLSNSSNAKLIRSEKDKIGLEHFRYQQTYMGIPVENAVYVMHVKGSNIRSQNGEWVKDFPATLKTGASLGFENALDKAKQFIGAAKYKWEVPEEEAFIKKESNDPSATFYPKQTLVFYSGPKQIDPSQLRLAYKLDVYAHYPASRRIVYVDAENGKILGENMITKHTNANGTAVTAYSGTQAITTDYTGTTYRLRETGRGLGIQTLNMKTAGANYNSAVDFTDADNNWNNVNTNKDQYATDAHWAAEKTYDYYFTKFNRNSIDNAGLALKSYVHVSLTAQGYPDNINAFWDGSRMSYGDGGSGYSPLTALDIAGHEITHGLTENSSNLNYVGESGALNEGFSDIFGTAIEFYARPARANWTIGEDIGASFRSMSNPKQFSQPNTYHGTYWQNTNCGTPTNANDACGVHTNSGVLNYWFYLLSQGASGTNDNGLAYNVTGLGIDKAGAIAFRTNTVYLVSTSQFADARTYAIKSAEDLYGVGSVEATTTACAWAAVGVGTCSTGTSCTAPSGLTASAITTTGATVSWTAVSGAASYAVDYKTTASATWISAATATTSTSVALSGLSASTAYDWRVKTTCSATSSSAYTAGTFTTAAVAGGCATAFEPNETQAAAVAITSGTTNSAAISSGTDIDYYKITTTAAGSIAYNLVGPSGVDYDLYIYNSAGTQIGAGTTGTATETVSLTSQAAGTYYIKVIGYNGANSATCYTIKATATPAATGCQSTYDVSTNGTTSGAATIPFNTNITGLISPSADIDNYKFVITTGGTITVTLGTLPADYDVKLLNSAGTQVGISQKSGTTAESIAYTAAAGTYYVQVFGYNGANSSTSCYTLKVATGTATIQAPATELITKAILKVYPNPAVSTVNVTLLGEVSSQSVLQVIDVKGTVVKEQKMVNSLQAVDVANLAKGVYIIKVLNGEKVLTSKFVKQ